MRDLFTGAAARTRLSYVTMVLAVAPIIAPTLGGWALLLAGWRSIYGFLGVAGVALTTAVALGLEETRPRAAAPAAARAGVLAGFGRMLRHRPAIACALANALNFGALFAFVSGSPLVLMGSLGLSAATYGLLFAITSGGIMAGARCSMPGSQRACHRSMQRPYAVALADLAACGGGTGRHHRRQARFRSRR